MIEYVNKHNVNAISHEMCLPVSICKIIYFIEYHTQWYTNND